MATTSGELVDGRHAVLGATLARAGGHTLTRRGFLRAAGLALGGLAVAGVTHDANHWFISQQKALWKFPVGFDLNTRVSAYAPLPSGVLRVGMPAALAALGYDHFGDIDHYRGYLFVPLERTGGEEITPAVAVFHVADLRYLGYDTLWPQPRVSGASWCAINPATGVLHSSSGTMPYLYRYQVDLAKAVLGGKRDFLGAPDHGHLHDEADRSLTDLKGVQGGAFTPDGRRLYVQANGIHVFDTGTVDNYRRIARSTNGSGAFNYEYHTGDHEEPEGLTYWDLNDGRAPHIRGVLHALMLDNDGWDSGELTGGADDLYFKHYW
jgi:hypothetical protein